MDESNQVYRCSWEDQRRATEQYARRKRLARNQPTYVHLTTQLDGHCAAVQVIVTPFSLQQFPGRCGFWPRYRYHVCHEEALTESTHQRIANVVQCVVGAYCNLAEWDISNTDCEARTFDPSALVLEATCATTAENILEHYLSSITPLAERVNNREVPSLEEGAYPKKPKRFRGNAPGRRQQAVAPTTISPKVVLGAENTPTTDEGKAVKIVSYIQNGLKTMSNVKTMSKDPHTTSMPDELSYEQFAEFLLKTAEKLSKDGQNSAWWAKFVAGCVSFASPSLPARPAQQEAVPTIPKSSRSTIGRWRAMAEFSIAVVSRLHSSWKEDAFHVLNAFAAMNTTLRDISDLGHERLMQVANQVVTLIQNEKHLIPAQRQFHHPASILSPLLSLSYETVCDALQLPKLSGLHRPLRTGLSKRRIAEAPDSFNKRFRGICQQSSQYPQGRCTGAGRNICSEPTSEEESAAQQLYQLQSQDSFPQCQTISGNQAPSGIVEPDGTEERSVVYGGDKSNDDLSDLVMNADVSEVIIRSETTLTDPQLLCSQIDGRGMDQAGADLQDAGHTIGGHNNIPLRTNAANRPEVTSSDGTEVSQSTSSQFLSERAESILAEARVEPTEGRDIDPDMDVYENFDVDDDMQLFQGYDIDRDMDFFKNK